MGDAQRGTAVQCVAASDLMMTISNWSQIGIWRYETVYRAYWPFWGGTLNHAACVSPFGTNAPTATKLRKN